MTNGVHEVSNARPGDFLRWRRGGHPDPRGAVVRLVEIAGKAVTITRHDGGSEQVQIDCLWRPTDACQEEAKLEFHRSWDKIQHQRKVEKIVAISSSAGYLHDLRELLEKGRAFDNGEMILMLEEAIMHIGDEMAETWGQGYIVGHDECALTIRQLKARLAGYEQEGRQ